jgi:coenzyme PQQ precursor peptide PqqA
MNSLWVRPDFEEICVGGECTAYAGALLSGPVRTADADKTAVAPSHYTSSTTQRERAEGR